MSVKAKGIAHINLKNMDQAIEIKILLIIVTGIYGLLAVTSIFLMIKPPKKVNSIYGYRSGNAGASQEAWDYANKLAPRLMLLIATVSLVLALASVYFLHNKIPVDGLYLICIMGMCLLQVIIIPVVEIKLGKLEERHKAGSA
ncbi:SdpI family protein [Adhaeribacter soli]|uniref:SdpI family protein n=1 Tax=Adhaeribacter soli TaxID=2607655 RepID=A0A5N1J1Q9_9BACT|nr:SdpI family protein [Adhaeribacter soli]KAA9340678.1 SdpI family protein [Adhaeribacter soli]